jgi:hypothetical protein
VTACTRIRSAVLLSAALSLSGAFTLLVAEAGDVGMPASHAALLLVLAGVVVLGLALLIAVWPGNARRLSACRH